MREWGAISLSANCSAQSQSDTRKSQIEINPKPSSHWRVVAVLDFEFNNFFVQRSPLTRLGEVFSFLFKLVHVSPLTRLGVDMPKFFYIFLTTPLPLSGMLHSIRVRLQIPSWINLFLHGSLEMLGSLCILLFYSFGKFF